MFVDNDAVLSRLVSGRGGGKIDNKILQHVLAWEQSSNVRAWYERVPSSANVADAPSRGDTAGLCPSLEITVDVPDVLHTLLELTL